MKTIEINNGEVRIGYEYTDLSEDVKNKVMSDQIQFEIDIMDEDSPYYYLVLKMEKMQTPWFLGEVIFENHKNDLIETININNYLFTEDGDILPITYYTEENKIVKTVIGNKEYDCTIKNR
ncbi:MAG: hypothetical protein PF487_13145 [Bacteroidales bacterium]|jgi:hypothetical protein|nr:hypothetical protein [Bacteroidales bacterium]